MVSALVDPGGQRARARHEVSASDRRGRERRVGSLIQGSGSIPARADVVIVGGGPAGSIAGTALSQKGYDVVLLEARKHPRYAVGESLFATIWPYCDQAGVTDKIMAEGFVEKSGGIIVWNGVIRQIDLRAFGYTRVGLHVERDRFDYLLLENAKERGVQVHEEVSATGVDFSSETPVVAYRSGTSGPRGTIACRFVVDGSGQAALLAKQQGTRIIDDGFRFMGVWGYFKGSKFVGKDARVYPHSDLRKVPPVTFVSSVGRWGWMWHITLREETSVGFVLPHDEMQPVKSGEADLATFFVDKCRETPYLSRLLESAVFCENSVRGIRDYSYRSTETAGHGYFMVGDALGFVDPIFSVGVSFGMFSAQAAAFAIHRTLRTPSRAAEWRSVFSDQVFAGLAMTRALALPNYGVRIEEDERITKMMSLRSHRDFDIMYAASAATSRNADFREVVEASMTGAPAPAPVRELDAIVF